jgi:hypothetical protein
MGSGIVVARLPDGGWSAPSAIATAGVSIGGQIGAELTEFVIILNTDDAVKAFSHGGNVTVGGNLSVAAGPVGRNAEAAGTIGNLAAIFSYSKTKGLFAGVSIEGSVIVERKDANRDFYHRKITASEILNGMVQRPTAAADLYQALDMRAGTHSGLGSLDNIQIPSSQGAKRGGVMTSPPPYQTASGNKPPTPDREARAVALFEFNAQRPDDLSFKKGEVIQVVRRTDSTNDWWFGRINGRSGNFPANYVQLQQ